MKERGLSNKRVKAITYSLVLASCPSNSFLFCLDSIRVITVSLATLGISLLGDGVPTAKLLPLSVLHTEGPLSAPCPLHNPFWVLCLRRQRKRNLWQSLYELMGDVPENRIHLHVSRFCVIGSVLAMLVIASRYNAKYPQLQTKNRWWHSTRCCNMICFWLLQMHGSTKHALLSKSARALSPCG